MPTIKVNTDKLAQYQSDFQVIFGRLNSILDQYNTVSGNLDWDIKVEENINSRLSTISRQFDSEIRAIGGMRDFLGEAIRQYDEVNSSNLKTELGGGTQEFDKTIHLKTQSGENVTVYARYKDVNRWISNNSTIKTLDTGVKKLSAMETILKYEKKIGKAEMDILGKFGTYGKQFSFPIALMKNLVDADGITAKDIGSSIKGLGNSVCGIIEYSFDKATKSAAELKGLGASPAIHAAKPGAGWLERLNCGSSSFADTAKNKISPVSVKSGTKNIDAVKTGTKVAGWALSLVANGFSNYDEHGGFTKRMVAETVTETVIDIGKDVAIGAGIALACGAVGFAAPVVVAGGMAVAASTFADIVCESLTNKSVTETVSDFLLDKAIPKTSEFLSGVATSYSNAVCGWINKIRSPALNSTVQSIGGR